MQEQDDDKNWRDQLTTDAVDAMLRKQADSSEDAAFLVVRRGSEWRDIFPLAATAVLTVGRDDNNRIVLKDESCSRWHCEVFFQQDRWVVRDLQSRNGTKVSGRRLEGDQGLVEGDIVTIGRTEILFTHDIAQRVNVSDTATGEDSGQRRAAPQILCRAANSNYFKRSGEDDSQLRHALAQLYEMVVEIAGSTTEQQLANTVLDGLLPLTSADIGAVLIAPPGVADCNDPDDLRIISHRAPEQTPYHKVSRRLSQSALSEREALLALDVASAPDQTEFKSLHGMNAQSVICAPLRFENRILGLLHIYSLGDQQLNADTLDLTLAVADQAAVHLANVRQRDALATVLEQARDENRRLKEQLEIESDLIGGSQGLQRLKNTIAKVARSDASVLVRGESGVGKELVARAVHFNSPRRDRPLVCLNCAALSETLLESELFGHEKGAFTGAVDRSVGKFEQADQGTLFLDEVGEMPLSIQAKFLRVLEGHPFERVGGNRSIDVDVRVVAATNRDLEEAVGKGEFRGDLFYRLQILEINIPPLRERRDDILSLADHFLQRATERMGMSAYSLTDDAKHRLHEYDWPGNIRELRNVIERAVVLSDDDRIGVDAIQMGRPVLDDARQENLFQPIALEQIERRHIERTLNYTKWKKRESARILGINRSTLDRKLERYGIRPPDDDK